MKKELKVMVKQVGFRDKLKNERGSLSIEFLGILPFYFLFFLLLWQVVASGYAVIHLKSVASDAAKLYAVSEDYYETKDLIDGAIGDSELLKNHTFEIRRDIYNPALFVIEIEADHSLVFLPANFKEKVPIKLDSKAIGKVLIP